MRCVSDWRRVANLLLLAVLVALLVAFTIVTGGSRTTASGAYLTTPADCPSGRMSVGNIDYNLSGKQELSPEELAARWFRSSDLRDDSAATLTDIYRGEDRREMAVVAEGDALAVLRFRYLDGFGWMWESIRECSFP